VPRVGNWAGVSPDRRRRVLLVSSSGGVLLELLALQSWWGSHDTRWVAVAASDTRELLTGRRVTWRPEPQLSRPHLLLGATARAVRSLRRDRVEVVLSAGSAVAVPYFIAARALGIPALWIETLNVIGRPGLSARLCARLANVVVVQHQELLAHHRRAVVVGQLY